MLEAFGLTWLAGVVSAVLSDALKERLKPPAEGQTARDRAYALFTALENVSRTTDAFVSSLSGYALLLESGVPEGVARLNQYGEPRPHDYWNASSDATIEDRHVRLRMAVAAPSGADTAVVRAQAILYASARELREALDKLEQPLKDLDPQLAIHQPDVAQGIDDYTASRAAVFLRLEDLAWLSLREDAVRELQAIAEQAEHNQRVIHQAIDEFRAFLAREFAFKESF